MKLTDAFCGVGLSHAVSGECEGVPHVSPVPSAPAGWVKDDDLADLRVVEAVPEPVDQHPLPTFSVGSIDPTGSGRA
jgi:hypothetical protein